MRPIPSSVSIIAVALAAVGTLAGCGDAGTEPASTATPTRAAAGIPPVWTCESKGDNENGPIKLEVRNETDWSIYLTSPKPADCAPWMGTQTPGQVNGAGYIETKTFPLLYDEFTDTAPLSDETGEWRTPLGINVHMPDDVSVFTPKLSLFRKTVKGLYTARRIAIRTAKGDVCEGSESFPWGRVTLTIALRCSDPGKGTWPYSAPAVVTITKS